jgi:uncharacterized protein (TIGR02217 family)
MFIDDTLLDRVAYGFTGGPTWATTRVQLISGRTKRNAERSLPLHRYSAPYDRIQDTDHATVLAAYMACIGPIHSFRFKDRSDYQLSDVTIGTAAGGADETMQLVKPYSFGSETLERKITKPVAGITLTEDDVGLAHTIDLLTGIVTFTSSAGKVIRATGEFDVPVYFDDDSMDFTFDNWAAHSTDVNLIEDFNA